MYVFLLQTYKSFACHNHLGPPLIVCTLQQWLRAYSYTWHFTIRSCKIMHSLRGLRAIVMWLMSNNKIHIFQIRKQRFYNLFILYILFVKLFTLNIFNICSESAMECATRTTEIRRNKWKSICRPALLNDNAPDSGLSDTSSSPLGSSKFCSLHILFILSWSIIF